ncbi:MAG TPA: CBS domain-containing protein [Dehalococcoidia bacterium]|nr:CBS domain-containing protein [Dehalococcoidia bacterium]
MADSSPKVKDFLRTKGRTVITIGPSDSVLTAIKKLVDNDIGALPVCDAKGSMLGIVSERDLLKESVQRDKSLGSIKIKDVMITNVIIGVLDDDLDYVMDIMTQRGIRHLPIMEGPELRSMISIRDVVDELLRQSKAQVRFLSDYISGGYV